jgi:hypothetical protein
VPNLQLLNSAKRIVSERLVASRGELPCPRRASHPDYLTRWQDNLIEGVTAADCEADLRRGDGSELDDRPTRFTGKIIPAKFCAPYSSSALAVNTFGPFRHHLMLPPIAGLVRFNKFEFEYPCGNGLRTKHRPNFDLFLQADDGAVAAIESKFLETLGSKRVEFSAQYDGPFRGYNGRPVAEEPWQTLFEELKTGRLKYTHLDAAQLVKHYLGLKVSFNDRPRTLIYIFWEPDNAADLEEFKKHRHEIADLSDRVDGCETQFLSISYADVWREWRSTTTGPRIAIHIARLRERYGFSL